MLEITVDEHSNRLYPHRKVLEAYTDEKRGNAFPRVRKPQDDIYDKWYATCKKNKIFLRAQNVIRTRTFIQGEVTEIIYYYANYIGTASSGPNQGQQQVWEDWVGYYDEPIFNRHLDKDTDTYVVDSIRDHIRRYELPFNAENMKKVLEVCDDATTLLVKETVDQQSMQIYDNRQNYAKADFNQLLIMGRTKKSLADLNAVQEATKQAVNEAKMVEKEALKKEDKEDAKQVQEVVKEEATKDEPAPVTAPEPEPVFKEETLDMDDKVSVKVVKKGNDKKKGKNK